MVGAGLVGSANDTTLVVEEEREGRGLVVWGWCTKYADDHSDVDGGVVDASVASLFIVTFV